MKRLKQFLLDEREFKILIKTFLKKILENKRKCLKSSEFLKQLLLNFDSFKTRHCSKRSECS